MYDILSVNLWQCFEPHSNTWNQSQGRTLSGIPSLIDLASPSTPSTHFAPKLDWATILKSGKKKKRKWREGKRKGVGKDAVLKCGSFANVCTSTSTVEMVHPRLEMFSHSFSSSFLTLLHKLSLVFFELQPFHTFAMFCQRLHFSLNC